MKTKTTTIREAIPEGSFDPDSDTSPQPFSSYDENDQALLELREKYGPAPLLLKVYKVGQGRPQYQFEVEGSDLDEAEIQRRCPLGGNFSVKVHIEGKIRDTIFLNIAPLPISTTNITPISENNTVLNMMREQNAMLQNLLISILTKPAPQQNTVMADVVSAWTMINSQSKNNDLLAIILPKIFDKALDGSGNESDWKTELLKVAKDVAPVIVSATMNNRNSAGVNGNQPVYLENPTQEYPQIPMAIQTQPQNQDIIALVKKGINYFKPKIRSNMLPVGLAIDWILCNADNPEFQPIIHMALNKDFNDWVAMDPDLANEPFKSWLTELIAEVKNAYESQNSEQPEAGDAA
jgi:hypothetical protein